MEKAGGFFMRRAPWQCSVPPNTATKVQLCSFHLHVLTGTALFLGNLCVLPENGASEQIDDDPRPPSTMILPSAWTPRKRWSKVGAAPHSLLCPRTDAGASINPLKSKPIEPESGVLLLVFVSLCCTS